MYLCVYRNKLYGEQWTLSKPWTSVNPSNTFCYEHMLLSPQNLYNKVLVSKVFEGEDMENN